ncbi:hypothetical protein CFBP5877_27690 (plasmid) [Agrobacterium tumefaciens]|uniref:HPr kinase/phosphorylase C-terminal domain-containing protein n=1 Tax=Agrobacterium tumefaciens TaxID=358 RepID=A0AAE6EIN2_AGRTU|nr:hypothetical protein [Agrobacterium tumefaciens]QCL82896.1 hypothetical protein CFBP5877_27690 [Agrobacterium tumefaciens]
MEENIRIPVASYYLGNTSYFISAETMEIASIAKSSLGLEFDEKADKGSSSFDIHLAVNGDVTVKADEVFAGVGVPEPTRPVGFYYNYLEPLIVLAAASKEYLPLHASSVKWHDKHIIFLGPRGAGKSTMSIACAAAGGVLISDDATFIKSSSDSELFITSTPRELHIEEATLCAWFSNGLTSNFSEYMPGSRKLAVGRSFLQTSICRFSKLDPRNTHVVLLESAWSQNSSVLEALPNETFGEHLRANLLSTPTYPAVVQRAVCDLAEISAMKLEKCALWRLYRHRDNIFDGAFPQKLQDTLSPIISS